MSERSRQAAIDRARHVVSAHPGQPLFWVELANRLRLNDEVAEALSWARWAVRAEMWPEQEVDTRAWTLLGHLFLDVGWFDQAELAYKRGCRQHSQARALLGQGNWPSAWAMAEKRWTENAIARESPPPPYFQGWPQATALTLWDEQGFGDTLQALRWLPGVCRPGLHLTLAVRSPLQRLLQHGLAFLEGDLNVCVRDDCDWTGICHGSLLSLPSLLEAKTWWNPEVVRWPQHPRASGRPRVALVWESGRYLEDPSLALEFRRKSIPELQRQELCMALEARGLEVVMLQPGFDLSSDADFLDQALLMQECDLLLSVDTAAAHLGGIIGHPTWLLLPWAAASRWQRLLPTTPIYPSMRLFRQPRHGDWPGLMVQLLKALDLWRNSQPVDSVI